MKLKYITAGLLAMAIAPMQAMAATSTSTLNVTMNSVAPSASIQISNIDFGDVLTTSTSADATGSISVTVTPNVAYTVELDGGINAATSAGRSTCRALKDPNGLNYFRAYRLYSDASYSTLWGDFDGANTCAGAESTNGRKVSKVGSGNAQNMTVFARANLLTRYLGNTPTDAVISDTITVTVTF